VADKSKLVQLSHREINAIISIVYPVLHSAQQAKRIVSDPKKALTEAGLSGEEIENVGKYFAEIAELTGTKLTFWV